MLEIKLSGNHDRQPQALKKNTYYQTFSLREDRITFLLDNTDRLLFVRSLNDVGHLCEDDIK